MHLSDAFGYIPEIACWDHLKGLKHGTGTELNKATEAIEEHNASLDGARVTIDFNIKKTA